MDGRVIAILSSLLFWFITYLISLFFVSFKFSYGIIPNKIRGKITEKKLYKYMAISAILFPFLSSKMFDFGAFLEPSNIIWGCYIQYFIIGMIFLWFVFAVVLSVILIYGLFIPNKIKFINRRNLLLAFFFHQIYSLIMIVIFWGVICIFSGDLHGINGSCL